ncbi:hypothetical protein SDC9_124772 [bioreactor metagenome]|uniref:Uncharacterized protein n=1 Tax=bioreactor metagenome TaxID=1076179 RepID=A0A645CLG2_9ZZZZ
MKIRRTAGPERRQADAERIDRFVGQKEQRRAVRPALHCRLREDHRDSKLRAGAQNAAVPAL